MQTFTSYLALKAALTALGPEETLPAVELTPALAEDILAHDPVNRDLRAGQVKKLAREIESGQWDPRKSPPLRFLPDGRLADGQHRCKAVIASGRAIMVTIAVVPDTLGLDQGVGRSLADQLKIHANLSDKTERELAAVVTKAICKIPLATDREQVAFFETHRDFILTCVRKPLAWLEDKELSVAAVVKPTLLAVTRAQEIMLHEAPETEVDELLEDIVNGGDTAPAGTPRQLVARQIWDALQSAHVKKGAKLKDVVRWVSVALEQKRRGHVKSIIMARFPGKGRSKKRPAPKVTQAALELVPTA